MQLTLHAEKLRKSGAFRIGNPYAVAVITAGDRIGEELGRTEVIESTLSPNWVTVIFVNADPALFMPFRVTVYDCNEKDDDQKVMAETNFEMTEVFESKGNIFVQSDGSSLVYAHVVQSQQGEAKGTFAFHFRGLDIKNIEAGVLGLGRSDPFFEIAKKNADHSAGIVRWNPVYRSETIHDNLNPYWKEGHLSLEELCYNDLGWPLRVSIWDWQKNGKHREIGEIETTIDDLRSHLALKGNADRENSVEMTKIGGTKKIGLLVVLKCEVQLD